MSGGGDVHSPAGLDLPALSRYFAGHVPGVRGPLRGELLFGGRSNLTYRLTDGTGVWVLRRPPLGGLTPSAHDMGREYRVMSALAGTDVPVPGTVALCEDAGVIGAPFSVVEYVGGEVLRTREDLDKVAGEDIRAAGFALVDVIARLHAVDPAAVGLERFGRPEGYLTRQVIRWQDQWTRVATRELPDIERLHGLLAERIPAASGTGIVHGDPRIDNAVLAPGLASVRALLDWEMATLGDPLADLALVLVYRHPLFEPMLGGSAASADDRMPTAAEQAEAYARRTGRDLAAMDFYLALACFKCAVIAEGIHARHVGGMTVGEGFGGIGDAVPGLAAAGLRAITGGQI